ncbi:SAM-dependent methyltransferase [Rhodobacteraceae bacterium WD3A24]|nr:SAM-dependent methyltransferase [Rhodobacteraceae bacterium WD3A24]
MENETSERGGPAARGHWDKTYQAREEQALTWFQETPQPALDLIASRVAPGAAILDAGGGASRLVDALLARGLGPVTVLDLSSEALAAARARLGPAAAGVTWIAADITRWTPPQRFALWHDRAVFHFLTDAADRAAYLHRMAAALPAGASAILSTFADDGPARCSGLEVSRYAPQTLAAEVARHAPGAFRPEEAFRHDHVTPKGAVQAFQTSVFARTEAPAPVAGLTPRG